MVTVRAFADAQVWQQFSDGRESEQVTDERLLYLSGLEYRRESFSEYLSDSPSEQPLKELGLQGGYIRLEFSSERKGLIAITEYTAQRRLTDSELELLAEYTSGQWTDGVGSNFSQSMAVATKLAIDIWPPDGDFIVQDAA